MRKSWQAARPARFGNSVFAGLGPAPASGWRPLSSFRGTGRFLAKQLELEALPSKEYVVMIFWAAASAFFICFLVPVPGSDSDHQKLGRVVCLQQRCASKSDPKNWTTNVIFFRPARLRFFCGCVWFQHLICRVHGMFFANIHCMLPCHVFLHCSTNM
jgi:hypothetical protein